MAVEIKSTPIDESPAYAPAIYTVTSSAHTGSSYRYIAQVYEGATLLGELKAVPHPENIYGKFNLSNIISGQLEETVDFETTPAYSAPSIQTDITVDFGEEWLSGSVSVRTTASVSDTKSYFNGSPFYEEFVDIHTSASAGSHPYEVRATGGHNKYPLTSRRTIQTVEGTKQWLYYLAVARTSVAELEVRNDVTGVTSSIALPAAISNDTEARVTAWRVDKDIIEASSSLSDLEKWSVRTRTTGGTATSEYISFELMDCQYWDLYSLYYLNRFGGVDSFSFNGKVNKQVNSNRDSYKVRRESINSSGVVNYSTSRHEEKDFHVSYDNRYTLNSGWVNEEQQDSAVDLQTSPLVWMEKPNGVIVPVRIAQNSLQIQNRNDGVISVRVQVTETETINRQRV